MAGSDFTALDRLSYRTRVKYFYDSVYDIGPDNYRNPSQYVVPTDKYGMRNARHLAHQHDPLWNAYVDIAKDGCSSVLAGKTSRGVRATGSGSST